MKKLPKEFKTKWLKALRSGEFKQGHGQLYRSHENSYCCLGVACKMLGYDVSSQGYITHVDHVDNFKKVPKMLVGYPTNDLTNVLASMNDAGTTRPENSIMPHKKYKTTRSFKQIANWIDKNL